jgi:predicted ABC-type ATPase
MSEERPQVVVIAGPNGAGKTTAAQTLLRGTLGVRTFVNADWIARGLSAFDPDSVALEAGRIMLNRLKQLAESRSSFAFETILLAERSPRGSANFAIPATGSPYSIYGCRTRRSQSCGSPSA